MRAAPRAARFASISGRQRPRSAASPSSSPRSLRTLDGESLATYTAFFRVIDQDARAARAAIALVLAQTSISSQVIDNLNASIHLRALLTDLFLVDEVLKGHKL